MRARMTKAQIAELEQRARYHVDSVPYAVSLRWVFYRLMQDGIYSEKGDWNRWKQQASKFRHNGTWPPDYLEDGTREIVCRGLDEAWTEKQVFDYLTDEDGLAVYFHDSHFTKQEYYVELWFEARAMQAQFERYTEEITLRPFGGDYTIGPKYQAARDLSRYGKRFDKPVKVLYFGDHDRKGKQIFHAATYGRKGCFKWCSVNVLFEFCGLTEDQIDDFRARGEPIPENPDKPGQYQWEALTDSQAREIISHGVQENLDLTLIEEMEKEAKEKAAKFAVKLDHAIEGLELDD